MIDVRQREDGKFEVWEQKTLKELGIAPNEHVSVWVITSSFWRWEHQHIRMMEK